MDPKLKARILFRILSLSPATKSKKDFETYAETGDLEGFWRFYQNSLAKQQRLGKRIEESDDVSFEMLQPAMEAVYRLGGDTPKMKA